MFRSTGIRGPLLVAALACLQISTLPAPRWAGAVPFRPDVLERLRIEGRLTSITAKDHDARARGCDQPRPTARGWLRQMDGPRPLHDRNAIVILVDFPDKPADQTSYPSDHYSGELFSVGSFPTGSMRDWYLENSYGRFNVTGQVTRWLRMPQPYSYYVDNQGGFGTYPNNAQRLTEDAVRAANSTIDFSQYDNDGPDGIPNSGDDDGIIDALFIVHAGRGREETGCDCDIHSHAWGVHTPVYVDGVYAYSYSMEPENGTRGVFGHEFGHVLGLPDLYDTDYSSRGVGSWCMMAFGSWGNGGLTPVQFLSWCKARLGFLDPVVPTTNLAGVVIPQVEASPTAYKLWTSGNPQNEYMLVENRQCVRTDAYLPGDGLLICHVDESIDGNDDENHPEVAVEQADGRFDLESNREADSGDPYPGSTWNWEFSDATVPGAHAYGGPPTHVAIDLRSDSDSAMVADLSVLPVSHDSIDTAPPTIWGTRQLPNTLDTSGPYVVRAMAGDDVRLASVVLQYSVNSGQSYAGVDMDSVGFFARSGAIPGQADGTAVRYYIVATDAAAHTVTDPPTAPASYYTFAVGAAPVLPPPVLRVPEDASTCQNLLAFLDWSDVIGRSAYEVEIGTGCGTGQHIETAASSTALQLQPETRYFWHVRTKNADGVYGNYSDCFSFTTGPGTSSPPTLVNPPDGAGLDSLCIFLDWGDVPGSNGYEVAVGARCDSMLTYSYPTASHEMLVLSANTQYFWRVRSLDACDNFGAASACESFTTGSMSGCNTPVLLEWFEGRRTPDGIELSWRVPVDLDLRAFNVYRTLLPDGERVRRNDEPIGPAAASGGTFRFVDVSIEPNADYAYSLYGLAPEGGEIRIGSLTVQWTGDALRDLDLSVARPNPFTSRTSITFRLPRGGPTILDVIDPSGKRIASLLSGEQAAGTHVISWDGVADGAGRRPLPSGIYFVRLRAGGEAFVRRVVIVR